MKHLDANRRARALTMPIGGRALPTPHYFPSISSLKTNLRPTEYFEILARLGHPSFLVSAYDIEHARSKRQFIAALKKHRRSHPTLILMDSGNYESFWTSSDDWNRSKYEAILSNEICDIAFCFDNQKPPKSIDRNVSGIVSSTKSSQKLAARTTVTPIVHCERKTLNATVLALVKKLNPPIIAIPERMLGDGLLARVQTLTSLRQELNKLENYVFLHLLGTGNPLSLILFALAGADSFDSLEWCQTTVDSRTGILYHFQQRDLVRDDCPFCDQTKGLNYTLATLGHNLHFYSAWMTKLQAVVSSGGEKELLKDHFSKEFLTELEAIWA